MVKQKMISCRVSECSYDIDYDIDTLIANLQRDKALYEKEGWTNLALDLGSDSWSDDRSVYMTGTRLETVKEATIRTSREAEYAAMSAERERREFDRLSKKFSNEAE